MKLGRDEIVVCVGLDVVVVTTGLGEETKLGWDGMNLGRDETV